MSCCDDYSSLGSPDPSSDPAALSLSKYYTYQDFKNDLGGDLSGVRAILKSTSCTGVYSMLYGTVFTNMEEVGNKMGYSYGAVATLFKIYMAKLAQEACSGGSQPWVPITPPLKPIVPVNPPLVPLCRPCAPCPPCSSEFLARSSDLNKNFFSKNYLWIILGAAVVVVLILLIFMLKRKKGRGALFKFF